MIFQFIPELQNLTIVISNVKKCRAKVALIQGPYMIAIDFKRVPSINYSTILFHSHWFQVKCPISQHATRTRVKFDRVKFKQLVMLLPSLAHSGKCPSDWVQSLPTTPSFVVWFCFPLFYEVFYLPKRKKKNSSRLLTKWNRGWLEVPSSIRQQAVDDKLIT